MFSPWQDARYFLRTLRNTPGFTAVVILTLALGIGANTAIFSIVNAVLLRPLPFPAPERLVRVVANAPGAGLRDIGLSTPELRDLQERSGVFEDIAAVWPIDANITGTGKPSGWRCWRLVRIISRCLARMRNWGACSDLKTWLMDSRKRR